MTYKIADEVAMRMIQIFQEACIFGVDGADLMRQVRLTVDPTDPEYLTLDLAYVVAVEEMHAKYMSDIDDKRNSVVVEGV